MISEKAKELGKESTIPYYVYGLPDKKGEVIVKVHDGLTKREHFASIAMNGLFSNSKALDYSQLTDSGDLKVIASDAVRFADALLEELSKE